MCGMCEAFTFGLMRSLATNTLNSCLACHNRIIYNSLVYCHNRAKGGELFRLISQDPLSEEQAREVTFQILDAVSHLHDHGIVHLDLKVRKCTRFRTQH